MQKALAVLLQPRANLYECYVGLIHFATQPERLQRFEEAAKREHRRITSRVGVWTRTVEAWDPDALQKMGEQLIAEAKRTEEHLAVAIAAALMTLDRALSKGAIEAHAEEVCLPPEKPFRGFRYRLLGPPEAPIEEWIKSVDLPEIPRSGADFEIDLPSTLGLRWRVFPVDPNPYQVTALFEQLPQHVAVQLRERVEQKSLTVGLVSPLEGLDYEFQSYADEIHPKDGSPYRFKEVKGDRSAAKRDMEIVLERCRKLQVDVLVYPELTLDGELLGHLREQLRWQNPDGFPAMVIAGSFHEQAEGAGSYVNRSRVFDHLGEEILRHDKLKRFRLTPADIAGMDKKRRVALCKSLGIEAAKGGHERIEPGDDHRGQQRVASRGEWGEGGGSRQATGLLLSALQRKRADPP